MSIFGSIMSKLGFGDDKVEEAVQTVAAEAPAAQNAAEEAPAPAEAVAAMSEVDVLAKLDELSSEHPGLNWKTSIVDLLKLLGLDSSFAHRKELAAEMGIEGYEGSAEQNIALHKAVLAKLAQNGGNIPAELLS